MLCEVAERETFRRKDTAYTASPDATNYAWERFVHTDKLDLALSVDPMLACLKNNVLRSQGEDKDVGVFQAGARG